VHRAFWVVLLLAGCGGGKTEIDITLKADDSVTDVMLQSVRTLHVETGGADPYSGDVGLGNHTLMRTERLAYRPRVDSGSVALTLTALDENGSLVACTAPAPITLSPGLGTPLFMTMHPCNGTPDFAVPDDQAVPDLSGADLSVPDGGVECPANAVKCDDFESGSLSAWMTDPTVSIDTSIAHHGTHSVKVHVTAPDMAAYQQTFFGFFTGTGWPLYVRAWVYLPSTTTAVNGNILYVLTALQSGTVILGYGAGTWGLGSQNLGPGEQAPEPGSTQMVHADTWTCVEWLIDPVAPGADGGQERVAFDTVDDPLLHATDVALSNPAQVLFGWEGLLGATQMVDVWFDDIAVAHTPMGCP
jgi:hypothetical protein